MSAEPSHRSVLTRSASSLCLLALAMGSSPGCAHGEPAPQATASSEAAPKEGTSPHPAGARVAHDDRFIIINGERHGLVAAERLESRAGGVPLAVAGHGLLLAVRPPAVVVNLDGPLLIGRRDGDFIVIRALIRPEAGVASQPPTATAEDRTFSTGPGGPTIFLEPQVDSLDAVFASVDVMGGEAYAWRAIGVGLASLPILPASTVFSVGEGRPEVFYLAPSTSKLDSIELNGPYRRLPRPEELLFPGARPDGTGTVAGEDGDITWHGLTYEHEGTPWRQRFYLLPIEAGGCMTLKVQTRASTAEDAFAMADELAAGFFGPRVGD